MLVGLATHVDWRPEGNGVKDPQSFRSLSLHIHESSRFVAWKSGLCARAAPS